MNIYINHKKFMYKERHPQLKITNGCLLIWFSSALEDSVSVETINLAQRHI